MVKEELIDWNEYPCGTNGQIYSHLTKKYLKGNVEKNGYKRVRLKCIDGKYRQFYWHRVIYTYFNGTIPEGYEINHIREFEKTDNRLCNLELVTPKENSNYGTRTKRSAAKHRGLKHTEEAKAKIAKKRSKAVVAVDKDNNIVLEFASTNEAGRNGFDQSTVSECCRNFYMREGNRFYKGYYWYYLEDYLKIKGDI